MDVPDEQQRYDERAVEVVATKKESPEHEENGRRPTGPRRRPDEKGWGGRVEN